MKVTVFWFRRDLRLQDNTALYEALKNNQHVLPIFIFDDDILGELPPDDPRVNFIYDELEKINMQLQKHGSSVLVLKGNPKKVWHELSLAQQIKAVYFNKDYEPYGINRDREIKNMLIFKGIQVLSFKDHVIHEESEVLKKDGTPYTVFTPYKNCWLSQYHKMTALPRANFSHLHQIQHAMPSKNTLGIAASPIKVKKFSLSTLSEYKKNRDFPAADATSYLGPHLRFGTVGVREVLTQLKASDDLFLSELIWREFFMQIMFHYPKVVERNFRPKYDGIQWLNNEHDFEKWCTGQTGYPMVDAGMRQLNATGYMHNRVRMVTAGFLCKHLLIDWRWGEGYFARKLLDYELSSNNGNWQWAAGTGCDAAPYFRIFNPHAQFKKFDAASAYVKKWVPEFDTDEYTRPLVVHDVARKRALETYKDGIEQRHG